MVAFQHVWLKLHVSCFVPTLCCFQVFPAAHSAFLLRRGGCPRAGIRQGMFRRHAPPPACKCGSRLLQLMHVLGLSPFFRNRPRSCAASAGLRHHSCPPRPYASHRSRSWCGQPAKPSFGIPLPNGYNRTEICHCLPTSGRMFYVGKCSRARSYDPPSSCGKKGTQRTPTLQAHGDTAKTYCTQRMRHCAVTCWRCHFTRARRAPRNASGGTRFPPIACFGSLVFGFICAKRQGKHSFKQQLQRELKSFREEQGAGFRQ